MIVKLAPVHKEPDCCGPSWWPPGDDGLHGWLSSVPFPGGWAWHEHYPSCGRWSGMGINTYSGDQHVWRRVWTASTHNPDTAPTPASGVKADTISCGHTGDSPAMVASMLPVDKTSMTAKQGYIAQPSISTSADSVQQTQGSPLLLLCVCKVESFLPHLETWLVWILRALVSQIFSNGTNDDNLFWVQPLQFVSMDRTVFGTGTLWVALAAAAGAPGQQVQDPIYMAWAMWQMMGQIFVQHHQSIQSYPTGTPKRTPRCLGTPSGPPMCPAPVTVQRPPHLMPVYPTQQGPPVPAIPGPNGRFTPVQSSQQGHPAPATPGPCGNSSDPVQFKPIALHSVANPITSSGSALLITFTVDFSRLPDFRTADHDKTTDTDQQIEDEYVNERDYEVFR